MVEAMVEGTRTEIHRWEQIVAQAGGIAEIDVDPDVHRISGRILSLTAFGGDFEKGEQIYKLQTQIAKEVFKVIRDVKSMLVPLYRYQMPFDVYIALLKKSNSQGNSPP